MKLFMSYLNIHLKIRLQYKMSFLLTLISQFLVMFLEIFTIYSLFDKFSLLDMYDINELLLGFSTIWLAFSLCEMFGRGFDHFSKLIVNGNFDMLLIRPRSVFIQIIGSDIGYEKISRVTASLLLFIYSSVKVLNTISLSKILLLIFMVVGGIAIIMGVFIIGASFCFVTIQGLEIINIITNGTRQLGQYPMGIYKKVVRKIFTFIIPLTLINYYPLDYLVGRTNNILYTFLPLLTLLFLIPAFILFKIGMCKYKSSGS